MDSYFPSGEGIDLTDSNLRLAFTIEDTFGTKKQKNDPRYVKWLVRLSGKHDGKSF